MRRERDRAVDTDRPPLDRLRLWMHAYRAATARAPLAVAVIVGAPVENALTLELYEALVEILRGAGRRSRSGMHSRS